MASRGVNTLHASNDINPNAETVEVSEMSFPVNGGERKVYKMLSQ